MCTTFLIHILLCSELILSESGVVPEILMFFFFNISFFICKMTKKKKKIDSNDTLHYIQTRACTLLIHQWNIRWAFGDLCSHILSNMNMNGYCIDIIFGALHM